MHVNITPGSLTAGSQRHAGEPTAPSTLMQGLRRGLLLSIVIWLLIGWSLTLLR